MIYQVLGYEEGMRETVYRCSEGYPTIGKGTVIGPKKRASEVVHASSK